MKSQAEWAVQSFKESLKKIRGGDIEAQICKILHQYHTKQYTTTNLSPAELLMNKKNGGEEKVWSTWEAEGVQEGRSGLC